MNSIRSPFFYVGDKYKLMPQLKNYFPSSIKNYVEPFVGGGSSFLNIEANRYYLNDLNEWMIKLHEFFLNGCKDKEKFINDLFSLIDKYELSCSYKENNIPVDLKKKYPKTYYAKYNYESYKKLKADFNKSKNEMDKLYLLLVYGFNHMIRFNSSGNFNLPVGDVDFNKNVFNSINNYLDLCLNRNIKLSCSDYKHFLGHLKVKPNDTFIYFDPPYLISSSEYNKYWKESDEYELYDLIDELDKKGFKFGITNLIHHKKLSNEILIDWCKKYRVYNVKSNYISFNDNTIKENSEEVYITNYDITKI